MIAQLGTPDYEAPHTVCAVLSGSADIFRETGWILALFRRSRFERPDMETFYGPETGL